MDSQLEELSPLPSSAQIPATTPAPVTDEFAHLDPLLTYPTEPAMQEPVSKNVPENAPRPLQPGKMGQLAAFEEPAPVSSSTPPALAPDPVPVAASIPAWKRPAVLAAFASAAIVAAGSAYMMLNKSAPSETLAELTPSAPMPAAPPAMPMETATTKPPLYTTPRAPSSLPPKIASPRPSTAAKSKRARKPKPKPARVANSGQGDTFIESRAPAPKKKARGKRAAKAAQTQSNQNGRDPLLESLLAEATGPDAGAVTAPSAAAPTQKTLPSIGQRPAASQSQFSLPGLQRPVSASDRAAATPTSDFDTTALAEPGETSPPPPPAGIENEPVKPSEGNQLALIQVHEQFDFCAQLLAQGAYGDHYDTCLCKDTRENPPYRGRRGYYVKAMEKDAKGGRLETTATILSSTIENGVAIVRANWKSGSSDKGRDSTQSWKLEDGLWCQAP